MATDVSKNQVTARNYRSFVEVVVKKDDDREEQINLAQRLTERNSQGQANVCLDKQFVSADGKVML